MDFEEALEDSNDKLLDDVIENNTESISKAKVKGKLINKENKLKKLSQIAKESGVSKDNYNIQSISYLTKILYDNQCEKNSPIFDVQEFIKIIESCEPKLKRLFNAFFLAMNPREKNQQTKEIRIPSATSIFQIAHMATILFNTAKALPIPFYSKYGFLVHNFNGVDSVLLKTILWEQYMISFANSYNFEKINWKWIHDIIYANKSELIKSLVVYSYDADIFERYRC
ncbi:1779_t:CDS:2 [Cetraspora pellucida]|uniref:1779_t:CDS:1 n=1 Tax=Cetraspora pellucida TaxID=1433469 RepID=A0ACA9KSU2_9GLOM|nr:1779_t:CDS:2 [Cetraspora pellucida]